MTDPFKIGQTDYIDVLNTLATSADVATVLANKIASEAAAATATSQASIATTKAGEANTSAINAAASAASINSQVAEATAQATIATTKAAEANASATTATTASSIAVTKASEATTAASSALDSLNAVNLIFDTFDDRFLGPKSVDPTTDNDGDPLVAGAVYYNTISLTIRFFNGIAWEDPSASATASASSALNSANTATTKAGIATTKAGEASNSAATASAQASIATTKASEAQTSAIFAEINADVATSQATLAVDKANIATAKALEALGSANTATTKATEASTSATDASTAATTATTKAAQAIQAYNDSIAIYGSLSAVNDAKIAAEAAATSASSSATTATTQAGIATNKAAEASTYSDAALTQAGIATTKATEAAGSATTASAQAGIATTKATEAAGSATTALAQAGIATTKAAEATSAAESIAGFDLTIGTVTEGAASATITGTVPNRILNLSIPKGDIGPAASDIEVFNDGVSIAAAATALNFTGAGVTASNAGGGAITINVPNNITSANVTDALGYTPINPNVLGQSNGIATLDGTGTIPSNQLPSYVDDVLEYANLASFPATGAAGKIYIALDTNKTYRWSGSTYVYITSGAVDSVAGKTGVVSLNKSDVGLSNVDNTSDINKPISNATQTALDGKQATIGYTPINKAGDTEVGNLSFAATIPILTFTETDQTGAAGKFRLIFNNDTASFQKNTAAAGDFSTTTLGWSVNSVGTLSATQFSGSGAGLTSIPNAALNNSSVTIGTTNVPLGSSVSGFYGLSALSLANNNSSTLVYITNDSSTAARYPGVTIRNYSGGFGGNPSIELQTARGNVTTPTSVLNGDTLGGVNTWGHNGTSFLGATRIDGIAESDFSISVNAGLVFKTANNNVVTERMRISSDGKVGIGVVPTAFGGSFNIAGSLGVHSYNANDAASYNLRFYKNRNSNVYANTIVQNNDQLGTISFFGADGTTYKQGASIRVEVDGIGTVSGTSMPSRIVFSTSSNGSTVPTERMRIDSTGSTNISGNLGITTTDPFIYFTESDQTLPAGKFRIGVTGNAFYLDKNTAADGGYSTLARAFTVNSFGELLTTTPATATNNTVVPTTAYTVARIAQDALLKTGGDLSGNLRILSTNPSLSLIESDQTTPEGRYRLIIEGNQAFFQKNTHVNGDYSTSTYVWGTDVSGAMYTLSPPTSSNNTKVATTEYVVARIAQDAASKGANTFTGDQSLSNNDILAAKTVVFNGEFDAGSSGSAITINWDNGQNQKVTLTAACNITFANMGTGHYQLRIVQDATGNRTANFVSLSGTRWLGATSAPALNTAANSETFLNIYYGGGVYTQTLSKVGVA